MSLIAYIPEIVKGRYVHVSYKKESCAIRDFIKSGDRPCRDYSTSQINKMIKDWLPADGIPFKDVDFWVRRLKNISKEKLGDKALIEFSVPVRNKYNNIKIENCVKKLMPNSFSLKKPNVLFYGERGIVNTLFIELSENKDAFKDFINMVITCEGKKLYEKEINDYQIIIEPDFGKVGFGTTDAVISINKELLILFEAKRCTFNEASTELTYQIELNYSIGKHFVEVDQIPPAINLEPVYSSDTNKQRGTRRGNLRRLYTNDEHKFFFEDFVKCKKFSCLSLTTDNTEKQITNYYSNVKGIELQNLSWIGYNSIKEIMRKHNLEWLEAHIEMNRRHFGFY